VIGPCVSSIGITNFMMPAKRKSSASRTCAVQSNRLAVFELICGIVVSPVRVGVERGILADSFGLTSLLTYTSNQPPRNRHDSISFLGRPEQPTAEAAK
jgi:hypothetical protein